MITPDNEAAYQELEIGKTDALNCGALEEYDRLLADQDALGEFRPIMQHSFIEETRPVIFHLQLLGDFNTIEKLGWKMLEELDL